MNLEKLKDTARKHEQKEEWRKAIEVYQRVLQAFESGEEAAPDLALYNKVGDLHLKVADIPAAVRSYERAVELYSEQGFSNNAIAVCGKILRYDPHRTRTYIQLARLHAKKNMAGEAKKNLIEYLDRMNRDNMRDTALRDVKEFADQFGSSDEIRSHLRGAAGMFPTLNIDLIFNQPHQTLASLERDLETVLVSGANQASFYPLMTSHTVARRMAGAMGLPDHRRLREFFSTIVARLQPEFTPTSAWCFTRNGQGSDEYIAEADYYVGVGSGAFSFVDGALYTTTFSLDTYARRIGQGALQTASRD